MQFPFVVRLLIAAVVSLILALVLAAIFYATGIGFDVWTRLREAPSWFIGAYAAVLLSVLAFGAWMLWRIISPRAERHADAAPSPPRSRTEAELEHELAAASAAGADMGPIRGELDKLRARRASGEVHVVLFGRVSTGKSALVKALLPAADVAVSPLAGTTRTIERYTWTSPQGDRLTLTDLPGLNEPDGTLDQLARDEAQRAHVVIYLVDGDLTRDQDLELQEVLAFEKPVILALSKSDLYSPDELDRILDKLWQRVESAPRTEVVTVTSKTTYDAVRVHPDGREEIVTRTQPPGVDALATALQRRIDEDADILDQLRDASVFMLAGRKLDESLSAHRRAKAKDITREYTRKAVVGALAAVGPGTDLIIQGYLGVQFIKALCELYGVPAKDIDTGKFLELAGGRARKAVPLTLAVAGNALKAFPGLGTVGGGLAHAVAYGMLFDSLGRAVANTLDTRGALPTKLALHTFEETLSDDLGTRARRLAKLALEQTAESIKDGPAAR